MKIGWKILIVLAIMVASTFLTSLSSTWQGIDLGSGWFGDCYSTKIGFPFNSISHPPDGFFCLSATNSRASSLNYLFWLVVLSLILFIVYKIAKNYSEKK